jgi:hypothetical protein
MGVLVVDGRLLMAGCVNGVSFIILTARKYVWCDVLVLQFPALLP